MANPYSAPTLTGYNANPPSDDGSETAANEITWSKHKDKIGDPLKTFAQAASDAVAAAFGKIAFNAVSSVASNYTVDEDDQGKLFILTTSDTITLPDATAVGSNFAIAVDNQGGGTIDGHSSQTIDGSANATYRAAIYVSDGSNFRTIARVGSVGLQDASAVAITGGTVTGITDIVVADGGTGVSSLTAYAPIFGGTTSTGAVQSGAVGNANYVLTDNGSAAIPTFQRNPGLWNYLASQATTSGTTKDFTIPAGAQDIEVFLSGVSTNSTSALLIQIGDVDGVDSSGYVSTGINVAGSSTGSGISTAGFIFGVNSVAADSVSGVAKLSLGDPATFLWALEGSISSQSGSTIHFKNSVGIKLLSAELTTVRITSVTPDTFDAGTAYCRWR